MCKKKRTRTKQTASPEKISAQAMGEKALATDPHPSHIAFLMALPLICLQNAFNWVGQVVFLFDTIMLCAVYGQWVHVWANRINNYYFW